MFDYEIYSESEAMNARYQILNEGEYDAVITSSSDTQSKTGNGMMDITVSVFDEHGKAHDVRDFLVFTKQMMWKIVHFSDSAGVLKEYEEGKLCSELIVGKRVKVRIIIEEGSEIPQDKLKGKPLGSKYPAKNKVDDYVKKGEQGVSSVQNPNTPPPFADDDIPFI